MWVESLVRSIQNKKSSDLESNYGTQSPRKKQKVGIEGIPPTSPFLSPHDSLQLLNSLGLVPLGDRTAHSSSSSGSDAALTNERGYFSSDSFSNASTDSEYASYC